MPMLVKGKTTKTLPDFSVSVRDTNGRIATALVARDVERRSEPPQVNLHTLDNLLYDDVLRLRNWLTDWLGHHRAKP
jgi:hypothetical protein